MSNALYYLLWLGAGLVVVAAISAVIARHLRLRLARRIKAQQTLEALTRYTEWVLAQHRTAYFQGAAQEEAILVQLQAVVREWFPELAQEAAEVFILHARMVDFLWSQHLLRRRDPEAWLEPDHDTRFTELLRRHLDAVDTVLQKLRPVAEIQGQPTGQTASPAWRASVRALRRAVRSREHRLPGM